MSDHTINWSLGQKILFRFSSCFFALYILGTPISFIFRALVPWFAAHILRLEKPITVFASGSGDTTYNYVRMLLYLLLALSATLIWSLFDRRRKNYQTLLYWVSVMVRYYLAMMMMTYGFIKIFHLQMPFPSLSHLIQPLGEKTPMGLAWNYVGFSKGFSFFTGFSEVFAGFFLFYRRTVTFGALLCTVVIINILAINLFFDVPVKLFSGTLLLMSLFLLTPDLKRLINFFFLNKATEAVELPIYTKKRWLRITTLVMKYLFIGYFFYHWIITAGIEAQKLYGDKMTKPPLYGLYDAELLIINRDTIPPLLTNAAHWKNLVIQWEGNAVIKMMNDSVINYNFTVDTLKKEVSFYRYADTVNLDYLKKDVHLIFTGKIKQDSIYIRLKERDLKSFRLMNTRFKWINEYPNNR